MCLWADNVLAQRQLSSSYFYTEHAIPNPNISHYVENRMIITTNFVYNADQYLQMKIGFAVFPSDDVIGFAPMFSIKGILPVNRYLNIGLSSTVAFLTTDSEEYGLFKNNVNYQQLMLTFGNKTNNLTVGAGRYYFERFEPIQNNKIAPFLSGKVALGESTFFIIENMDFVENVRLLTGGLEYEYRNFQLTSGLTYIINNKPKNIAVDLNEVMILPFVGFKYQM